MGPAFLWAIAYNRTDQVAGPFSGHRRGNNRTKGQTFGNFVGADTWPSRAEPSRDGAGRGGL